MPVSRPYAVASVTGAQSRRAVPPDPKDLTPQECARRERIIQAGLSLLIKRPYEQVKVRDVANGAGVALGTVYRYFASKEHLFTAVHLAWQDRFRRQLRARPPKAVDNRTLLTEIAIRAIRSFQRQPNFYATMVMASRTTDPHARALAQGELWRHSEDIFAVPLSGLTPDDRRAIVMLIGAMLDWTIGAWRAGGTTIDEVDRGMERMIGLLKLPD